MPIDPSTLIEAAIERADETAEAAQDAAREALNIYFLGSNANLTQAVPGLRSAPPAYTGNVNIVPDILNAFAEAFGDLKVELTEALAYYIANFFPETVRAATDDWITNTILYGGTGIPAAIEDAIWERARAREVKEGVRMEAEAITTFAARGFTMPAGTLFDKVLQVQQDVADKASSINRELAIKNVEIEIQNIRFAVEQGVSIRASVLGALGNFIRAYLSPTELAVQKVSLISDARSHLMNSAAAYYQAMVSEAQLSVSIADINSRTYEGINNNNLNAVVKAIDAKINAAVGVAQVLGQLAAGASAATVSFAGQETTAFTDAV